MLQVYEKYTFFESFMSVTNPVRIWIILIRIRNRDKYNTKNLQGFPQVVDTAIDSTQPVQNNDDLM